MVRKKKEDSRKEDKIHKEVRHEDRRDDQDEWKKIGQVRQDRKRCGTIERSPELLSDTA